MSNQLSKNYKDLFGRNWIIFIFPYRGVGGVGTLFLKLADIFSKKYKLNVGIVDYRDGFISRNLENNKNIKFFEYSDNEILNLPESSYLIFQSMTPWSIFKNLKFENNQKLFFWNLHPFNFLIFFPFFRKFFERNINLSIFLSKTLLLFYRKRIIKFISFLYKKNSIFFMDDCNFLTTKEFYNLKTNRRILPIGTNIPKVNMFSQKEKNNNKKLNAGWLGRAEGFKKPILIKVLRDLNEYALENKAEIDFIIISDQIGNIDISPFKEINIKFIGQIDPKELSKISSLEIDIFFAMGLSAFEVASFGIPTVLLDFSYNKIPDSYRYKFLFESDKYSAGELITYKKNFLGKTMFEIIKELKKQDNSLSHQTYKFIKENHDIENIAKEFLDYVSQSEAKYKDLFDKKFLKPSLAYTISKILKNKI